MKIWNCTIVNASLRTDICFHSARYVTLAFQTNHLFCLAWELWEYNKIGYYNIKEVHSTHMNGFQQFILLFHACCYKHNYFIFWVCTIIKWNWIYLNWFWMVSLFKLKNLVCFLLNTNLKKVFNFDFDFSMSIRYHFQSMWTIIIIV